MKIVVVYQREPHARQLAFDDVEQPATFEERVALARRMLADLQLDVEVWVDDLGDSSRAAFGDLPSWAVMLSEEGTIMRKLAWPDPKTLADFTKDLPTRRASSSIPNKRLQASLARARDRQLPPLSAGAGAQAAGQHDRCAHLAFLVEAAPEHAARASWLRELADNGPAWQRAWARAKR